MLGFYDPEIQQAKQSVTTFTTPDGLPAFFAALHFWAKLELHSQQVKAANARTLAQMEAAEAVPFGETPDAEDRVEALGFPLLKHWLNDPEAYARLHAKRAAGWAEYRKAMKGESK